jgi:molybdenum cofactor cytidylyltransferase
VSIAASALRGAGCEPVFVVLGAGADEARPLVPEWCEVVVNPDWEVGLSTSVKAGLAAAAEDPEFDGVLATLVDLPWLTAQHALDALAMVDPAKARSQAKRTMVDGKPGHPVYIGRDHWEPLTQNLEGDEGAGNYIAKVVG